jgi:hypothetical protein
MLTSALVLSGSALADAGDQVGRTVANVGDVRTTGLSGIAIAIPFDDTMGTNAGCVCVFTWNGIMYEPTEIFGTRPGDRFGWSVDGSQGRVIIGTPYNGERGWRAGRAWVYEWDAGSKSFVLWRSWLGRSAGDRYGNAVATGIDVNHDGFDDFLVGAPYVDRPGKGNCGAVYVMSGRTGRYMKRICGESRGDLFGWSVDSVGRANRDDRGDFVVGAPRNDDGATNAGKVYVISGRNYKTLYSFHGDQKGEYLGRAVAGILRADDDSFYDVAAGAPYYDRGSRRNTGRVIAYSSKRGEKMWHKYGRRKNDWFGWCVERAYDANCDSNDDVLIGAPRYDTPGFVDNGRVYVRSGRTGRYIESLYAPRGRVQSRSRFGFCGTALEAHPFRWKTTVMYWIGAPLYDDPGSVNEGMTFCLESTYTCGPSPIREGLAEIPTFDGGTPGVATRFDEDELDEPGAPLDGPAPGLEEPRDAMDDMDDPDVSMLPEDFSVGDVLRLVEERLESEE